MLHLRGERGQVAESFAGTCARTMTIVVQVFFGSYSCSVNDSHSKST